MSGTTITGGLPAGFGPMIKTFDDQPAMPPCISSWRAMDGSVQVAQGECARDMNRFERVLSQVIEVCDHVSGVGKKVSLILLSLGEQNIPPLPTYPESTDKKNWNSDVDGQVENIHAQLKQIEAACDIILYQTVQES